ncbi:hypothetical protein Gasu2_36310 [Galdieria sulphuraria]|uniref:Uncharacterized protein n=1 Tax=Galdieria sulphuraria TaxID=130081 RepID=M2XUP7_GALSU|nr:uncharacterized protein Gasu_52470 [Galdieria sulphuraria]EME27144.1 hypothetical protein Gasu_52470 [Galdieria sulphuraria]GJD09374.1 hypothetical protein Gasu2_36310 [Galdieria sulphuraria]|eukprot:XP_005703664.1 hypothetical protein Gasu_52470 [Galdieria sulphuraria]
MRAGKKRFLTYLGIIASINIPATAYFLSVMRWSKNKGGGIYSEGFSFWRSFLPRSLREKSSETKKTVTSVS